MIALEDLYFEWLLLQIDQDGVTEGVVHVCDLLHNCEFHRRVGNDINRAIDGANLRKEFLLEFNEADFNPNVTNSLLMQECSWLEMLIALARKLDYIYEGGVNGRFIELLTNMHLGPIASFNPDRSLGTSNYDYTFVRTTTSDIDNNRFQFNGKDGLFPLRKRPPVDQRTVEIWDQHSAYFGEKLEGVLWTSSN